MELFLGETIPEEVEQDIFLGTNDVFAAKAATYTYFIDQERLPGFIDEWFEIFDESIQEMAVEFNKETEHIDVYVLTIGGVREAFRGDIRDDLQLI